MEKGMYLNLQFKRAFKLYPSILIITVVTFLGIVLLGVGILNSGNKDSSAVYVRTGVVGDVEGSYLGIGVEAIKKMDSSRFYIDLVNMTEPEARDALIKGEISGYVYIPKGFINDVTSGENVSLKYISAGDSAGINALVEQEVVTTIANLVTDSQKFIYGAVDIGRDFGIKNIYQKINKLNMSYITLVLNRDSIYELVTVDSVNSLGYGGYYICAVIVFFLLIWGISCNRITEDCQYELSGLLNQGGIGYIRQFLARYISFFAVTYLTLLIFATSFGLIAGSINFGIPEILGADIVTSVAFIIKIMPAVFMFTLMHMTLCEVFKGIGGLLSQFIIMIIMGYLSGLFYPTGFFPQGMQTIMAYLPVGASFTYIKNTLSGAGVFKTFCLLMGYSFIFFTLSVCIRKNKVRGGARV